MRSSFFFFKLTFLGEGPLGGGGAILPVAPCGNSLQSGLIFVYKAVKLDIFVLDNFDII